MTPSKAGLKQDNCDALCLCYEQRKPLQFLTISLIHNIGRFISILAKHPCFLCLKRTENIHEELTTHFPLGNLIDKEISFTKCAH